MKSQPIRGLEVLPRVDARVEITGDHPWAGHEGMVIRHETIRVSTPRARKGAVVELDNSRHCFLFYAASWKYSSS